MKKKQKYFNNVNVSAAAGYKNKNKLISVFYLFQPTKNPLEK